MIPRAQLQAWSHLSAQLVQTGFIFAAVLSLIGTMCLILSVWGLIGGQWLFALYGGVVSTVTLLASFLVNAMVRMIAAMFALLLDMQHSLDDLSVSSGGVSYGLDDRHNPT